MKKLFSRFFIILFVFLSFSCSNTFSKKASIVVDLPYGNGARETVAVDDSLDSDTFVYIISLIKDGVTINGYEGGSGDKIVFDDLDAGTYLIEGIAENKKTKVEYIASNTVEIKAGETTSVNLVFRSQKTSNDGLVEYSVVADSIDTLIELMAAGYRDIGISSTIEIPDEYEIAPENYVTLVKVFEENQPMIKISEGFTVLIKNITFHGNSVDLGEDSNSSSDEYRATYPSSLNNSPLVYIDNASVSFEKCEFMNNRYATSNSSNFGGALCINGSDSEVYIKDTYFTQNSCENGYGGAIFCSEGTVVLDEKVRILDNVSELGGGGIYVCNSGKISQIGNNTKVNNNYTTGNGGGIYVAGGSEYLISNGYVSENSSFENGGGIYVAANGKLCVYKADGTEKTQITSNSSINCGGGLYVDGNGDTKVYLNYVLFNDNSSCGDVNLSAVLYFEKESQPTSAGFVKYYNGDSEVNLNSTGKINGSYSPQLECSSTESLPEDF